MEVSDGTSIVFPNSVGPQGQSILGKGHVRRRQPDGLRKGDVRKPARRVFAQIRGCSARERATSHGCSMVSPTGRSKGSWFWQVDVDGRGGEAHKCRIRVRDPHTSRRFGKGGAREPSASWVCELQYQGKRRYRQH